MKLIHRQANPDCSSNESNFDQMVSANVFLHAANYVTIYNSKYHRLDASRRTDGFSRTRRNERLSLKCLFVLVLARGQAAVCASPTLKRSVRKYN